MSFQAKGPTAANAAAGTQSTAEIANATKLSAAAKNIDTLLSKLPADYKLREGSSSTTYRPAGHRLLDKSEALNMLQTGKDFSITHASWGGSEAPILSYQADVSHMGRVDAKPVQQFETMLTKIIDAETKRGWGK